MARPTKAMLVAKEALFLRGLRLCNECKQELPLSAFGAYKRDKYGLRPACRQCTNSLNRDAWSLYIEKPGVRARHNESKLNYWRQLSPGEQYTKDRINRLKRLYGVSPDDFVTLLEKQNGKCGVCRQDINEMPSVDHSHITGKVRGLLHNSCNRGIGLLKDDPEILELAAQYLRSA